MRTRWLTFVWGFSESVLFFLVPDILLTREPLLDRTSKWGLVGLALLGALAGGAASYLLIQLVGEAYTNVLDRVPGISEGMMIDAQRAVADTGMWAVIKGSFQGVPYKLYAHAASQENIPLWLFLLWSIPARGIRFALVMLLSREVGKRLGGVSRTTQSRIHLGFWIVFYVGYFSYFPR